MIKRFLLLEWKSFLRSASYGSNVALKIIMAIFGIFFLAFFTLMGISSYFIIEELKLDPFTTINQFLIYYLVSDLLFRYFLQKMPVMNIRPFLSLPISKNKIVHYALGKTIVSFFNWVHLFFFIPFTIICFSKGLNPTIFLWCLAMLSFIYINNFLNILANNKDSIFFTALIILSGFGVCQFYGIFDITVYTKSFFQSMYSTNYMFLIPVIIAVLLYYFSFKYFRNNLYLDERLSKKSEVATTENLSWLENFGSLGTFLKNDIRLLKRNKRSKMTIFMSILFLFYGLLFFSNIYEGYNNPAMHVFAGIFVTGGFLFTFGQFIPSWDSAYYQLMMSQNIPYRDYIKSKWWLMVIATAISTVLAIPYMYFGIHIYLIIVVGAIFNIGVNSHLVMLAGAYIKTPIDLSTTKQAFGDKQAFNLKSLLLSLPKLVLPMILYSLGYYMFSPNVGLILVALAGILGFSLRNYVFDKIENVYKQEKYATIAAYKQGK
jgi:hypothetical protein